MGSRRPPGDVGEPADGAEADNGTRADGRQSPAVLDRRDRPARPCDEDDTDGGKEEGHDKTHPTDRQGRAVAQGDTGGTQSPEDDADRGEDARDDEDDPPDVGALAPEHLGNTFEERAIGWS